MSNIMSKEEEMQLRNQLDKAIKDSNTLAKMVSDAYSRPKCTKPHCDCLEVAEKEAGSTVKNYPCLAPMEDVSELKSDLKKLLAQQPQTSGLRWVNGFSRLPSSDVKSVFIRNVQTKSGGMILVSVLKEMYNLENVEWLDESSETYTQDMAELLKFFMANFHVTGTEIRKNEGGDMKIPGEFYTIDQVVQLFFQNKNQ